MPISMYETSIPVMQRLMRNLAGVLEKAEAHATAKKIDADVLPNCRLALDMFPLKRQVQIATDMAKGAAARLAGTEAPKWEDTEVTLAELKGRLNKAIDYLGSFKPEQIDGSETRTITLTIGGQPKELEGHRYLMTHVYPHFYFHIVTAFDILRHNGVDVGKRDYVGAF
jgi:uncharacterized protein